VIDEVGFDASFSFVYSVDRVRRLPIFQDDTPTRELARLQRLQAAISRHAASISASMLDSRQPVLVEGPSKRDGGS